MSSKRKQKASAGKREKIGLKKEDTLNRAKWRDGVQAIAEGMG